jgi:RNA polymerase sigma-70 factor (ECF subfamily)
MAILRNVCRVEYARRGALAAVQGELGDEATETASENLWGESEASPEAMTLRQFDSTTVQRLIAELPEPFREAIVLREINGMSYRDISEVIEAPIGTVMSRLARARALLRAAWLAEGRGPTS